MTARPFDPAWLGVEGVFGGFVLGRVVEAAGAGDGFVPQSVTVHFVSLVREGEADLRVETLHRGRATVSRRIELRQDGRLRAHGLASLVPAAQEPLWEPDVDTGPWRSPDTWPAPDPDPRLPFSALFDVRVVGDWSLDGGSAAWVRLRRDVALGPHAVAAVLLDLLPPGLLTTERPAVFVPTVDFTVHFVPCLDAAVASSWVVVTNRTVWAAHDVCVDESALYTAGGRLLAQLRQGRTVRWRR